MVAAVSPRVASAGDNAISPVAQALYQRAIMFDANLSPPFEDTFPLSKDAAEMVRTSGVTAAKTSFAGTDSNFEDTVAELAFVQRTIEGNPDLYIQIREAADFTKAKQTNRFGILFSFESANMFDGKPARIELFRNMGVRVMQLSYNKTSPFGAGVMADPKSGLSAEGHKAVEMMNHVGVALDLSHASPATTNDALALSAKPVLITHCGCAAIHKHPRNKTDEQLRAIARKGGTVGIFDLPYLTRSPKQPGIDDYMAHVTHALKVCGEDHVGIGSDSSLAPFDTSEKGMAAFRENVEYRRKTGVAAPEEDRPLYVEGLNTPRRSEIIADALLKRGYSERVAEKVLGANFINALTAIWS